MFDICFQQARKKMHPKRGMCSKYFKRDIKIKYHVRKLIPREGFKFKLEQWKARNSKFLCYYDS